VDAALATLQHAAPDAVEEAGAADAIAGVSARFVARPRRASDVAALVTAAAELGLTVVPRGARTKLDWGLPPEQLGLVLDCSHFAGVIEHAVPDLVVRAEPGLALAALQARLAESGQRLPIDEVVPGSTLGGVVATGISGPLRLRFGSVRDLLIGVGFVRGYGVAVKSGSKVVKNVAGYDLAKLLTGSYGTLGIITEVIFRLRALPNDAQLVLGSCADEHDAARALTAIAALQVAPSAVEIYRRGNGPVLLGVLLEGAVPVDGRAEEVARVLGQDATAVDRPPWWGALPGTTTLKAVVPPVAVPALLGAVAGARPTRRDPTGRDPTGPDSTGPDTDTETVCTGSAGAGVIFIGLAPEAPDAVAAEVRAVRAACAAAGGSAVVLRCPPEIAAAVDVWGPVPGLELMRRVKSEFDPARRLSPGRFVGGI
jgi:glycolate oxidase FAD binding subunit